MKRRTLSTSLLLVGSSFFAGSIVAAEFSDQAQVTSVRAVFGSAPQTRCWVDREQIREERRGDVNIPGAVVGAIVGGVIGHQVGGGRGRDIATAGGAVAGSRRQRGTRRPGRPLQRARGPAMRTGAIERTARLLGCRIQLSRTSFQYPVELRPRAADPGARQHRTGISAASRLQNERRKGRQLRPFRHYIDARCGLWPPR
jgi:hypothetical protein